MNFNCEICILGTGPAARICSILLKDTNHLVVGSGITMGSLSKFKIHDKELNLIPIFPVYQSALYQELWKDQNVKHNFLEYIDYGDVVIGFEKIQHLILKAKPESYAVEHLKKKNDIHTQKNILLAYKLFGDIIFDKRLSRLSNKVQRHYDNKMPRARIGFVNVLSPYYEKLQAIPERVFLVEEVKEIDIEKKIVHTTRSEIKYQRLISTLNLREMISKVRTVPDIKLISKPASFYIFKTTYSLDSHKVIYDLEIKSPIYRVFTIDPNFLIVQLSQIYTLEDGGSDLIVNRLKHFFGDGFCVCFEYYYSIQDAYPLDTSSDEALKQYVSELEANDVLLIGRFAEWEYVDLHELNYSRIR